jgi:hydrogenase nickel incorporation protein HypA/HybF
MHELGLAQGILDLVRQSVPEADLPAVRAVRVRVGEMAGVVADSLDFCFSAILTGTPCEKAFLAIEHVPPRASCRACRTEFSLRVPVFQCPSCGGTDVTLVAGRELDVVAVDLEEAPMGERT